VAGPTHGAAVSWTDWTSAVIGPSGSASGTMGTVSVTYSGEVLFAQTSEGINYWNPSAPYLSQYVDNAPPDSDIVALVGGNQTVNRITFSSPVVNPVMAIVSLGNAAAVVQYRFDTPFDVLSSEKGYWGGGPNSLTELDGNILSGIEGHGAIQFFGTYTSISWTVPQAEYWHGFTVGVDPPSAVPQPPTVWLLIAGVASLAILKQRLR
jgi:hypothetical protein